MTPHQPYSVGTPSPYGKDDIDLYDWAIHFVDGELGRLLQALKDADRLANTYVIVAADHGQAFGEHGNRLHGITVYQEETRIPLLVWGPGVRPGTRKQPVSLLDLFPTILELGGAMAAPSACGASLRSWLEDPARAPTRALYLEQIPDTRRYFQVGYVQGEHKLVITPPEGAIELFDLRADPRELHDLSGQNPKLTDRMVEALIEYQRKHGIDPASFGL
jgi:arylsulfatase A-like enzyme